MMITSIGEDHDRITYRSYPDQVQKSQFQIEEIFKILTIGLKGGAEQYDVLWLHNEKEIKPSKDFEYKSSGQTHSLVIQEIFPEDAGSYTCEAFNDVGECFSTCSLVVEVPGEEVDMSLTLTNQCILQT